jgi:hypothetical protein
MVVPKTTSPPVRDIISKNNNSGVVLEINNKYMSELNTPKPKTEKRADTKQFFIDA